MNGRVTILLALFLCLGHAARPQGCIAIRNITGFGQFAALGYGKTDAKWMMNVDFRFFRANHLYVKDVKQPNDGLINDNRTMNFTLTRILDHGWLVSLDLPIASNTASLVHPSGDRHIIQAFGISDIRFTVYKWVRNIDEPKKWNLQAGLGIKLPTGNYHSQDYIYTSATAKMLSTLPGSLQLGDGGTGITTELNAYYIFNDHISAYGNIFYMFSPVDQNGTTSGFPATPAQIQATYDVTSVPDAYSSRAGVNITLNRWVLSTGMRYEGSPGKDVFGESHGLRRAGYIFSSESGIQYKLKTGFFYSFFTLPLSKGTVQSAPDKVYSQLDDPDSNPVHVAGVPYTSPGHFSSFLVFVGYAFMF